MSDRAACSACGKPVNAAVKVCPHCGHGRGGGGSLRDVKISVDEARALLTMTGRSADDAPRSVGWFLAPHPQLYGQAAIVERVATAVSAPVWAPGFISVLAMGRKRFDRGGLAGGEGSVGIVVGLAGLLTLWPVAGWLLGGAATTVLAVTTVAWAVRTMLRYGATLRRSRALSQLDKPQPALSAPSSAAETPAPAPPPPAPIAPAEPDVDLAATDDGPRRLR